MSLIKSWTPDQAGAAYNLVELIREEILKTHKESIHYYQRREKRREEYAQYLEQLTEGERIEQGVLLEPKEPDDPIPF